MTVLKCVNSCIEWQFVKFIKTIREDVVALVTYNCISKTFLVAAFKTNLSG